MAAITQVRAFGAHTGRRYGSFAGRVTVDPPGGFEAYWRARRNLADWRASENKLDWRAKENKADWSTA